MLRNPHLLAHFISPSLPPCLLWLSGHSNPEFQAGIRSKKVWEEPEGKGVSAAWNGAWDHVKELDGDWVGSCPLQQEEESQEGSLLKKMSYCYLGWILVLGSWWQGLSSQPCQDILLSDMKQNNFCLNFLVSKNTFNLSVRGGEERMLEQNIFSTVTWKVILMNDNLLSIIIPKYKIGSVFYVIWNGVWSYWQGCWLPGGS